MPPAHHPLQPQQIRHPVTKRTTIHGPTDSRTRPLRLHTPEPLVLQGLRRHIRISGLKLSTETAYVKWAKRFVDRFELPLNSTWETITESHVEDFLSELVLERNVAPRDQGLPGPDDLAA